MSLLRNGTRIDARTGEPVPDSIRTANEHVVPAESYVYELAGLAEFGVARRRAADRHHLDRSETVSAREGLEPT